MSRRDIRLAWVATFAFAVAVIVAIVCGYALDWSIS